MSTRKMASAMYGANTKEATTGAIRMVQVRAPGATSRARWIRRWAGLKVAGFATVPRLEQPTRWRCPLFGVILGAGLDRFDWSRLSDAPPKGWLAVGPPVKARSNLMRYKERP